MRIACVYLPSFALQVHVRQAPYLWGRAFVVGNENRVSLCSKGAWERGIRPGMSVAQARDRLPGLGVETYAADSYWRAKRALGETLFEFSQIVDVGQPGNESANIAIYLAVPKKHRGDSFAARLLASLNRQGYQGRVGVADDRFTAWAAARTPADGDLFPKLWCTVPRGGSAAFLAPLPLGLLPMEQDIRSMLETLGIATLGDFAELPPPSHDQRKHNNTGAGGGWEQQDFRKLAAGCGPTYLTPMSSTGKIVERISLPVPAATWTDLLYALRPLADRTCDQLRGREMAARRVELQLTSFSGRHTAVVVDLSCPTRDGSQLFSMLRTEVLPLPHAVSEMKMTISQEYPPVAHRPIRMAKTRVDPPRLIQVAPVPHRGPRRAKPPEHGVTSGRTRRFSAKHQVLPEPRQTVLPL